MNEWTTLELTEHPETMGEWIRIHSTMCILDICIDKMKSAVANKSTNKLSISIDQILSILSKQEHHIRKINNVESLV